MSGRTPDLLLGIVGEQTLFAACEELADAHGTTIRGEMIRLFDRVTDGSGFVGRIRARLDNEAAADGIHGNGGAE